MSQTTPFQVYNISAFLLYLKHQAIFGRINYFHVVSFHFYSVCSVMLKIYSSKVLKFSIAFPWNPGPGYKVVELKQKIKEYRSKQFEFGNIAKVWINSLLIRNVLICLVLPECYSPECFNIHLTNFWE